MDLHTETDTSNHYNYSLWNLPITLYILTGRPLVFFCIPGFNSLLQLTIDLNVAAFTLKNWELTKVKVTLRLTTSQSVSLGVKPQIFIATIFYCLRLKTSLFVASYDSQGHGGGIRPRLHTGLSPGVSEWELTAHSSRYMAATRTAQKSFSIVVVWCAYRDVA
jgi:hypothetical protein